MKQKILVIAAILLVTGTLYATRDRWLKITQYLTVGTQTKQGKLTVFANATDDKVIVARGMTSQTGNLLDCQNSSGTTLAKIASDGDLTSVDGTFTGNVAITGTLAPTGATTFSGQVTINDNLLVDNDGVSDVPVRIDGTSGQAVDLLQVRAYDGTEYFDVTSAGNLGIKIGATHTTGNIALKVYTSDPCGSLGANKGPWLNNASPSKMCFCDSATDDMIVDGSTDCF